MKLLRQIGSLAFVLGLFTALFVGMPWYVIVADDPVLPWWLRTAIFCLLGGILVVLLTLALEQSKKNVSERAVLPSDPVGKVLLSNFDVAPGGEATEVLGLVQGHTVFSIWIGKDLSALVRLILGGELIEYTEMMGQARTIATGRMVALADEMGADAIINVRYMTTSVVGTASEIFAYGTAVKIGK